MKKNISTPPKAYRYFGGNVVPTKEEIRYERNTFILFFIVLLGCLGLMSLWLLG